MAFFGFDIAALAGALFMQAALEVCPVEPAPKVEAHFAADPVYYNEGHGSVTLRRSMEKDKESTLNTDKRKTVFGVTTSITESNFRVSFKTMTDSRGNQCLYVDKAVFWITYKPAVFVSKDIIDLPCSLAVTRAHEAEHVRIDIEAIQEYLPQIQIEMMQYLRALGYQGFGPYKQGEMEKHQQRLLQEIVAASKPMAERLREARRKRQGIIDTPENYRREAEKCPQDRDAIKNRFYAAPPVNARP